MRPHPLVHRGVVLAHGLVLQSRHDALAHWSSADRLLEGPDGVVVLWNTPRTLRAEAAPGPPLVRCGGGLCTAPVDVPDGVYVVRGGALRPIDASPVEPAEWLDVSGLQVETLRALASPPPAATAVVTDLPKGRALFADLVGEAAPSSADALFEPLPLGPPPALVRAVGGLLRWLRSGRSGRSTGSGAAAGGGAEGTALAPRGPTWLQQLEDRVASWIQSRGLDGLLAPAQSRYLAEMVRLFDSQDWERALLHAIPLDGEAGLQRLAGRLRARSSLQFGGGGPAAHIDLGDELRARMRRYYETARDALMAQERWREAAYVQSELLNQPAQAVSMLSEAGQWALAAELAESKELETTHVIALWFRAGDIARATALARRTSAWQHVYDRLNARDRTQALRWRMAWAASLVAEGRHGAAVRVLRTLPQSVWRDTLALAMQATPIQGDLWVLWVLEVQGLEAERERIEALLQDGSLEGERLRTQVASCLRGRKASDEGALLLRHLARARMTLDGRTVQWSVPGALGADLPPEHSPSPPTDLELPPHATGPLGIHDALPLPHGAAWLALGDAGVVRMGPDGGCTARMELPATHLIPGADGGPILTLARGPELSRIGRFGPQGAHRWTDAQLQWAAPTHQNGRWLVVDPQGLAAIDLAAPGWQSVWRAPFEGPVRAFQGEDLVHVIAEGELWTYRLRDLRLQTRRAVRVERFGKGARVVGVGARGDLFLYDGRNLFTPRRAGEQPNWKMFSHRPVRSVSLRGATALVATSDGVHVLDTRTNTPLHTVQGLQEPSARWTGQGLTVCDQGGRVIQIPDHGDPVVRTPWLR